jgi:flagellar biosynthetic protein FlhB
MSEEDSETDKSEAASAFKLKRARERGSIARSMDLGFFAALAASIAFLWIGGVKLAFALAQASSETLAAAPAIGGRPQVLGEVVYRLAAPAAYPLVVFAGALFGIALLLDFLQVGPVFSTAPLKPDFGRINPAKGFKRLLSPRMLIEAVKATVKLAAYGVIAWLVIGHLLTIEARTLTDAANLGAMLMHQTLRLLMYFALAALAFAILDQLNVRRDFAKKMRMSRREVKREHRDHEGEPRMKQKRKQFYREFSNAVRALRDVRGSDIIIANPDHYAVALRYDPATMEAPRITARGAGALALRIKRIGFVYGVVTAYDPPLARALFRHGRLGGGVPPDLYAPVADLYLRHRLGKKAAA